MFGNLVQIELIRLTKSTILKISSAVAIFLLFFFLAVSDLLIRFGGLQLIPIENYSSASFKMAIIEVSFQGCVMLVSGLTVAFTTCSYHKYRLAVNIEGAVRSRVKLCLSELTGIAVFVGIVSLFVLPAAALALVGEPVDVIRVFVFDDVSVYYAYAFAFISGMFTSVTVYLLSKIVHNAPAAIALSLLILLAGLVLAIFSAGFIQGYKDAGGNLPSGIEDIIGTAGLLLPIVLLAVIAFLKNKRMDRV